ncbi:hypothetical protein [Variovorax sp. GB1P17]|uniref:hypothetical protein n=1 Tax=Variovorax sp. GB1P17 TaxID=3443740 RepID=UPI003F476A5B
MTFKHSMGWRGAMRAAGTACVACLLIAGCGGGGSGGGGGGLPLAAMLPNAPAASVASGDGAATAEVPITAPPTPGNCAACGPDAQPAPVLNSKLDCAP